MSCSKDIDIANAMIELAAAGSLEADNQGEERQNDNQVLNATKEKLANHNPSLAEWADDLKMERRLVGTRSIPHYWHPRLNDIWYGRWSNSGHHLGLLSAILQAEGLNEAAPPPKAPPPPREQNVPTGRSTLLTDGQVVESVRAVNGLVRHCQALQSQVTQLTADLKQRDDDLRELDDLHAKLKRRKRD